MVATESGEPSIRSFLAIELPGAVVTALSKLRETLQADGLRASWVRHANYHLTLCFLGNITQNDRAIVESFLSAACASLDAFQLEVGGCGVFPSPQSPRVVWAGILNLPQALFGLAAVTEDAACTAGLEPVRGPFVPHITLGRFRNPRLQQNIEQILRNHADFRGGAVPVDRVSLFTSELTDGGANHERIASFPLKTTG